MRALANNRDISGLLGVPVLQVDAWAWTMSGAIAGVSGILLANMVRLQALILTFLVIPAVAAAIAGRMRSLYATVIGGLLIGIAEAMGTPFPYVGSFRGLAPFIFAVAALLWLQRRGQLLFSTGSGARRQRSEACTASPPQAGGAIWSAQSARDRRRRRSSPCSFPTLRPPTGSRR